MSLPKSNIPFSLVVITKNEVTNIERCLNSVPFAHEVIVLDSESTDGTRELAERLGAKVFNEAFRGFRDQKQRATDLASHPWVLSLDADEALSPEAQAEVSQLLSEEPAEAAYSFPRKSFHLGRWILHGGWFPDRQIRLFHREKTGWGEGHIHEKIQADRVHELKFPILHWVFKSLSHQVETNNKYSGLGALDLQERGKRFSVFKLIFRPIFKFLEVYIAKRGFLDGLPGFIIAVGASYSLFLRYAKLWEIQHLQKKDSK